MTDAGPAAEASSPPAASAVLCREKARSIVHRYAIAGTAWSVLPIPVATSPGLVALEAHMIYWIARLYGDSPSHTDTLMTAAGLEIGSTGLKTVARHLVGYIPVIGWGIRGAIAGGAIVGIGEIIIKHYESKYPNKVVA